MSQDSYNSEVGELSEAGPRVKVVDLEEVVLPEEDKQEL